MMSGQLHAPVALLPDKGPLVPIEYRLDAPQGRPGRFGQELNLLPLLLLPETATIPRASSS
jgi:hypothetical protein